jgi:hypothetical protein
MQVGSVAWWWWVGVFGIPVIDEAVTRRAATSPCDVERRIGSPAGENLAWPAGCGAGFPEAAWLPGLDIGMSSYGVGRRCGPVWGAGLVAGDRLLRPLRA